MNNPYWGNICAIAERQRKKGIRTYGKGLERNPADTITRIGFEEVEKQLLADELLDRKEEILKD